ncbi:specifically androgen-regulated gene protein isoform 1-T2 [Anableps anableps]
MPKSETWPGGTESETMNGMDSAGSCDSVVSANSGFSEDSLEHLSAEEKACLMFLEETIESLDNEDDSGLSHDEPERLPAPGNLSAKLADLSVSMGKSNVNGSQNQPIKKNVDTKHMQSYLVPTPLVVASGSQCSVPSTKSLTPVDKTASSKSQFTSKNNKPVPSHNQKHTAPPAPLEGNVVIPPSTKTRENSAKPAEGPLPRGPLSYDALVHLRRNASQKKTPLCPTVDHTIDLDRQCPPSMEGPKFGNVTKPDKSLSDVYKSKTGPPVVLPKPKKIPTNIYVKIQNEEPITRDLSESVKQATNPEVVRLEALQKLGLLKEHEHEDGADARQPPQKPHSKKPARDPSDPTRNSSFCSSQEKTEPKNRLQNNRAGLHQPSKEEQTPVLLLHVQSQSSELKTEGVECSVNQDSNKNKGKHPQHKSSAKSLKATSRFQPSSNTTADSVGYTAVVVPGVGSDRKEALRKLGLLNS